MPWQANEQLNFLQLREGISQIRSAGSFSTVEQLERMHFAQVCLHDFAMILPLMCCLHTCLIIIPRSECGYPKETLIALSANGTEENTADKNSHHGYVALLAGHKTSLTHCAHKCRR